jgi:hypothetical protein
VLERIKFRPIRPDIAIVVHSRRIEAVEQVKRATYAVGRVIPRSFVELFEGKRAHYTIAIGGAGKDRFVAATGWAALTLCGGRGEVGLETAILVVDLLNTFHNY